MIKITCGVTGGIASGKSHVSKVFHIRGIPTVDADIISRQIVEPGTAGLSKLIDHFGQQYLTGCGSLDRIALGNLVFNDKKSMQDLNTIMAPMLHEEADRQIEHLHNLGNEIVCYDAALIVEQGHADKYRPLIVVYCKPEQQLERLMRRNSFTEVEALARINAQLPVEDKIRVADYLIDTSQDISDSVRQVNDIVDKLYVRLFRKKIEAGLITYDEVPQRYHDYLGHYRVEDIDG